AVPDAVSAATAPDSAFPYVLLGEMDATPDDVSTGDDGEVETVTLHVMSRYRGKKEAEQIMQRIKARLHGVELEVPGRASAISFVRSRRIFLEPDGRTQHGVVSVEVTHRN